MSKKKKKVTYSLVCFLCSLKASITNCLFAFYVIHEWRFICLLFMLFMSESHLFAFYVCKSFSKESLKLFPNNLLYITTLDYDEIDFDKIEVKNNICINVFGYDIPQVRTVSH